MCALAARSPTLRISMDETYSIFFKSICGLRSSLFNAALDRKIKLVSVNDEEDDIELTAMEGTTLTACRAK
jgi:hypothetical protein